MILSNDIDQREFTKPGSKSGNAQISFIYIIIYIYKDFWLQIIELKIILFQLENCARTQVLILQTHRKKCWDHNVKKYIPDETSAGENNCLISAEKSTTPSNQYLRPEKLLMIDMSIKCVSRDHPQLINNMICAMQTIYTVATLAGIYMNALIKTP